MHAHSLKVSLIGQFDTDHHSSAMFTAHFKFIRNFIHKKP